MWEGDEGREGGRASERKRCWMRGVQGQNCGCSMCTIKEEKKKKGGQMSHLWYGQVGPTEGDALVFL